MREHGWEKRVVNGEVRKVKTFLDGRVYTTTSKVTSPASLLTVVFVIMAWVTSISAPADLQWFAGMWLMGACVSAFHWWRDARDNRRVLREHEEETRLKEEKRQARKDQWLREQQQERELADERRERELQDRRKRRQEAANRLKERRKHHDGATQWAQHQEEVAEEEHQGHTAGHSEHELEERRKHREEATHWAQHQERVAEDERKRADERRESELQEKRKRREEAANRAQHRKRVADEEHRRRIEALLRRDAVRDEINYMSGAEFERFMADLFRQKGYSVQETKATGDQGVDLLLPDVEGKRVAVQLKRWTGPVGNRAVQATFAGMAHYEAHEGWIITTSTFTKSARELARSTRVRLIDGKELGEWLEGLGERE